MTSRILQEDSGLILTQASDILVNNNFIGVTAFPLVRLYFKQQQCRKYMGYSVLTY